MRRTIDGIVQSLRFNGVDAFAALTRGGDKIHLAWSGQTSCGARAVVPVDILHGVRPERICRSCFSSEVKA